jgi:hypothetical protein
MPGEIHNYWLGIMALSFAAAMLIWILLVFLADRHPFGRARGHPPTRGDVTGGSFSAAQGGRQVMPDPTKEPVVPAPRGADDTELEPAAAGRESEQD